MTLREAILAARKGEPIRMTDGTTQFEFEFGPDDAIFRGHFPTHPLLPGIVQLEMTRMAAEWVLTGPLDLREISKAKFQRPILPAERIRLELSVTAAGQTIRAKGVYSVDGQLAGETTLRLWRNE